MSDVSCQTFDFDTGNGSEDTQDALRINPFQRGGGAEKKGTDNSTNQTENVTKKNSTLPEIRVAKRSTVVLEEECYPMDNEKRGLCLVFEQDTFAPYLGVSGRAGSEVDLKAVVKTFTNLGFDVNVHKNLNYYDITNVLEDVSTVINHSRSDCFVLIFQSHGQHGTVYAYDAPFPTQKLWEPFTADRAPTLIGKPKLFFIQACQGSKMDLGVNVTQTDGFDQTDSIGFASYKVPAHGDFLVSHSTMSDYYSWRNTSAGSWFIQSLVYVLENRENENRDILSMLTLVARRVTQEYESMSSRKEFNNKKQTPFFYSTLTLKLYLEEKK